jgi:hypothetical protein
MRGSKNRFVATSRKSLAPVVGQSIASGGAQCRGTPSSGGGAEVCRMGGRQGCAVLS